MRLVHVADPEQRVRHRDLGALGDLEEQVDGAGDLHAVTAEDQRPLGGRDHLGQVVRLGHVAADGSQQPRQPQLIGLRIGDRCLELQHVLREVEQHRAGPPAAGDLEGLGDCVRDLIGVHDHGGELGDRQRDADDIGLLEGVLAEQRPRDIAGDGDHRHRVHHGRGQAGDEVDGTGAAGGDRHAHAAGCAAVAVGRVRAALLMADEDVAQRELAQHVVDGQDRPAGVAEDGGDALADQRLAYGARTDARRDLLGGRKGAVRERECSHVAWVPLVKQEPRLAPWPGGVAVALFGCLSGYSV